MCEINDIMWDVDQPARETGHTAGVEPPLPVL